MTLSDTQYQRPYIKSLTPNEQLPSTEEIEFFDETTFECEEQEDKV